MKDIVNIEDARKARVGYSDSPTIAPTNYYIYRYDEDGLPDGSIMLRSSDRIGTTCLVCETSISIDFIDFCQLVTDRFCFFDTRFRCKECSEKLTPTN